MKNYENQALAMLRMYLAVTMIIHAAARIWTGGVEPFGGFLTIKGFPLGAALAWAITIFELLGGVMLIVGTFTKVVSILFAFQLMMGIVLVHAKDGWFVVGLGRNGMEYSALLIFCFLVTAVSAKGNKSFNPETPKD